MPRTLAPVTLVLVLVASACGKKDDTTAAATTAATPAAATAGEPEPAATAAADGTPAVDDTGAPANPTVLDGKAGDEAKVADDAEAADEAKAADEAAADEAKAAEGGETGAAAPDPKALDAEVKNKKTTDDRALQALTELETTGAKPRDLAKAATARGQKLFETPDRAKVFFEWAAAKDPKYPDPVFQLAKQAAVLGEVDEAKKYLVEVHKRGGKKLLSQIDFDPMWEIVKDDPEIRKLL